MRSSTTRKRPSLSLIAATVMSGFHAMRDIIMAGGLADRSCSATSRDSQSLFWGTRIPNSIKLGQVQFGHGRIVEVSDAVPGISAHAVDHRAVIVIQIGGCALRGLGGDVADVDTA